MPWRQGQQGPQSQPVIEELGFHQKVGTALAQPSLSTPFSLSCCLHLITAPAVLSLANIFLPLGAHADPSTPTLLYPPSASPYSIINAFQPQGCPVETAL